MSKEQVTSTSMMMLKLKMKTAFTKNAKKKISEQARDYAEILEGDIQSLAIARMAINKKKRIAEMGKRRDEFLDFAEYIDSINTKESIGDILNLSKQAKKLGNNMFIDKTYSGMGYEKILNMNGYKSKNRDGEEEEVEKEDKKPNKKEFAPSGSNKDTKKKEKIIKINKDITTPQKIEDTNKEIYEYLVKSGQLDAADYVLDLMTRPDTEKRTSGEFATSKEILRLSEINSGILKKLDEIEKNMIDLQDTSVDSIPEKIKQISQDSTNTSQAPEEKSGGWLSMIGGILSGLLGSFFGMDLLKFFKSLSPLKLADKIGKFLSLGWDTIKTKVDDLIKMTWNSVIKPIIDKLPSWDSIYKFLDTHVFQHLKKVMDMIPSWESIGKLVTKIGDAVKDLPGMADLKKFISENTKKVADAGAEALKATKDLAGDVADKAKSLASDSVNFVKNSVSDSIGNVIDDPKIAKKVSKEVGEVAAGTLGKKIPFIGIGVGAALAAARANEGDFVGAGLEALSGLVSVVPGFGTAASVGIDSYLMYRDIMTPEKYEEALMDKLSEAGIFEKAWWGDNTIKDRSRLNELSTENLEVLLEKGKLDEASRNEIQLVLNARSEQSRLKELKLKEEEIVARGGSKAEIEKLYNEMNYDVELGKFKPNNAPDAFTQQIYNSGVEKVGNVYLPKGDIKTILDDVAKEFNVPIGEMYATAYAESSFNPRAGASTSSAKGLFQFLTGTWNEVRSNNPDIVKKYGIGEAVKEGNDDRFDPRKSAIMYALLRKGNLKSLGKLTTGNQSTDTYLAHFAGAGGGRSVIKALNTEPNKSIASVLGTDSYIANKQLMSYPNGTPLSVKDFVEKLHNLKGGNLASKYELEANKLAGKNTETTLAVNGSDIENNKTGDKTIEVATNNVNVIERNKTKAQNYANKDSSNTIINNSKKEESDVRLNDMFTLKNYAV